MKKFLIVISVCALLMSCSTEKKGITVRDDVKTHSELVAVLSDEFGAPTIYFDNYQVDEKGKYTFYDKDYKYAGECYPTKGFAIGRNLNKVKDVK